MAEAELNILDQVKKGLGITGNYHNDMLQIHIEEVKSYMIDSGVKKSVVDSAASVGAIIRGVSDLWNFQSGEVKFSDYFMKRVIQLAAIAPVAEVVNDV